MAPQFCTYKTSCPHTHSQYPLLSTNHTKLNNMNTRIVSLQGQAVIPRECTYIERSVPTRGSASDCHAPLPPLCSADLTRQANLVTAESTLTLPKRLSNCTG